MWLFSDEKSLTSSPQGSRTKLVRVATSSYQRLAFRPTSRTTSARRRSAARAPASHRSSLPSPFTLIRSGVGRGSRDGLHRERPQRLARRLPGCRVERQIVPWADDPAVGHMAHGKIRSLVWTAAVKRDELILAETRHAGLPVRRPD